MDAAPVFGGDRSVKRLSDGFMVLIADGSDLRVDSVVDSRDEAEERAMNAVKSSGRLTKTKAYVLKVCLALELA